MDIRLEHVWRLSEQRDPRQIFPRVMQLLVLVEETGSLAAVCEQEGLSYRHAWGLLQEGADLFETPLVEMTRGKGTRLSALGQRLIWAERRARARLQQISDSVACEVAQDMALALGTDGSGLQVRASHCFAMEHLFDTLGHQYPNNKLLWCNSSDAVRALRSGYCDLAGFHECPDVAVSQDQDDFDPDEHMLILLAQRQLGLLLPAGNPQKIYTLSDLTRRETRWVHWQRGTAMRDVFDALLERHQLCDTRWDQPAPPENAHLGIASCIAGGKADAGFGLETAARRFGLDFVPLTSNRYVLGINKARMKQRQLQTLQGILNKPAFRQAIDALPGYDASQTGEVLI